MGKSILIVDDSTPIRRMVMNVLSSEGHRLAEARNGKEGVAIASETVFDLVITDVNMPEMNGFEFAKSLRQIPDYKFAPIIFLTTESSDEFRSKGREVGATAWLTKPFGPHNLLQVVGKVTGK